jgi:glycosyltransferase involved in cell wall biosynthesis
MAVGTQRARAARSLACLLAQGALPRLEIVLADLRPDLDGIEGAEHPAVRILDASERPGIGAAMARCALAARSPFVAFIEDHCYAEPGWAEAILDAFRRPEVAMVNYAFRDAGPEGYLTRAFLFTEYGRWMHPAREGPVPIASLNNLAYRVAELRRFDPDTLPDRLEVAHELNREIQRGGGVAWLAPRAVAAHEGWTDFRSGCRGNGVLKRVYSGRLAERNRWGAVRRLLYAKAMVIAPVLHLWRLAWSVRHRPRLWGTFLATLPVSLPVYVYSSYQEALGYLFGPGGAREAFTEMEVGSPRGG